MFGVLIFLTFVTTILCMLAMELTREKLPILFAKAQAERTSELDAIISEQPWIFYTLRLVIFGYLAALAALGWDVPGAKYALLILSISWTGVSTFYAPNIQHRIAVPFYEFSLILNGAVLAVAFLR
jgi:hypothetical protein